MRSQVISLWARNSRIQPVAVSAFLLICGAPLAGSGAIIVSSQSAAVWVDFYGGTFLDDGSRESHSYTWSQSTSSSGPISVSVSADSAGALLDGSTPLSIPLPNTPQFGEAIQTSLVTDGQIAFSASLDARNSGRYEGTYYLPEAYSVFNLRFQVTEDTDFVLRLTDFASHASDGVGNDEIKLIRDVPYPGPDDVMFRFDTWDAGIAVGLSTPPCVPAGDQCIANDGQSGGLLATPWPLQLTSGNYHFSANMGIRPYGEHGAISLGIDLQAVPEPGTALLVMTGLLGLAGWRRSSA